MKLKIFSEFQKKTKAFRITAVITAVVIIVLAIILYILTPNVPAKSISFPNTTLYLEKDMTCKLIPECKPYNTNTQNLIYRCSDTDIASISRNTLTALNEGSVFVYCYDKKSNVKSNIITVNVVESIAELIPVSEVQNEEVYMENGGDEAIYVYYTPNGKRYHRATCYSLGEKIRKTTLSNAQSEGLTPCSKCKP